MGATGGGTAAERSAQALAARAAAAGSGLRRAGAATGAARAACTVTATGAAATGTLGRSGGTADTVVGGGAAGRACFTVRRTTIVGAGAGAAERAATGRGRGETGAAWGRAAPERGRSRWRSVATAPPPSIASPAVIAAPFATSGVASRGATSLPKRRATTPGGRGRERREVQRGERGLEPAAQPAARPEEQRLDGGRRDAELGGDLVVGAPAELAQDDGVALLRGEPADLLPEERRRRVRGSLLVHVGRAVRRLSASSSGSRMRRRMRRRHSWRAIVASHASPSRGREPASSAW